MNFIKDAPSPSILPEHLIAVMVKNRINPTVGAIDLIFKLKKDKPKKYGALLSKINDATYNGIFFYSECLQEAIFNLMFCGIICWNSSGRYDLVKEEVLDSYLKCSLTVCDESVAPLLDELVKDLKGGLLYV